MNKMENLIAIIKNGIVESIVVGSDEWAASLSEETVNVTGLGVSLGWKYNNGEFTDAEGRSMDEVKELRKITGERIWRNAELAATDWIVQIPDHPKKLQYTAYRKQLRDYPTQPDFPNGERPIKPE